MRKKEEELAGISRAQRQIGFKKEMEVEDLKTETFETLYALGSLGAQRHVHSLETAEKKHLSSSLKVSNMKQI